MNKFARFLLIGLLVISIGIVGTSVAYSLSAQNAATPGETLTSDTDATTAVKMKGVFWIIATGTGTGTLTVSRSEDGTTYVNVKAITYAGADKAIYMYESFGDVDSGTGAYYKVTLSNVAVSHIHVRIAR